MSNQTRDSVAGSTSQATTDFIDGTEVLTLSECQEFLRMGGVGILALCGVSTPVLRPINFVVHEETVVIRTGEGQILEAASGLEPASFAISEIDRLEHSGWSIIVTGKLAEYSRVGDIGEISLRPWARAEKHHLVGLSIEQISGRRIPEDWAG